MPPPSLPGRSTRQQTLTQIDFVSPIPPSPVEDLEYLEDDRYDVPKPKRRRTGKGPRIDMAAQDKGNNAKGVMRPPLMTESHMIKPEYPVTPRKRRPSEVPSSQSPPTSVSPVKGETKKAREPLGEISKNRRSVRRSPAGGKIPSLTVKSSASWENEESQVSTVSSASDRSWKSQEVKTWATGSAEVTEIPKADTSVNNETTEQPGPDVKKEAPIPETTSTKRRSSPSSVIQDSEDESDPDEDDLPDLFGPTPDGQSVSVAPPIANVTSPAPRPGASVHVKIQPLTFVGPDLCPQIPRTSSPLPQPPTSPTESQAASAQLTFDIAHSTQHPSSIHLTSSSPFFTQPPPLSSPTASAVMFSQASTLSQSSPAHHCHPSDRARDDGPPPTSSTQSEREPTAAGQGGRVGDAGLEEQYSVYERESQLLPASLMASWLPAPPEESDDGGS